MRHILMPVLIGSALLLHSGNVSFAGQYYQDPQIVSGIGPETSGVRVYNPGQGYIRPQPQPQRYAMPRPAYQPRSSFGGGLLEAIVGGGDHAAAPAPAYTARVAYNGAEPQAYPYGTEAYAVRPEKAIDPMFQRQTVDFSGGQAPGTILIDTQNKFLYLVQAGGHALRYGIGVGRPGFLWTGEKTITRKAEWPDWTPPAEMIQRRPDLPSHMAGGIANPLGARAMYLGSSLYRIHGTNEPETIGTNVSSGCIRLTNDDVSDLFGRVKVGTRVIVM